MSIFNSLGSNYDFNFVLKSLFSRGNDDLKSFLENKYKGQVTLVYKGREAIELALKNLKLQSGSFVAINSFTCFAVYESIKNAGLNVEYLDIDTGELNFSAQHLLAKLKDNPKIKVLIIQNTLGYPCQIEEITKICKERGIILIEDLAHSIGTKYANGREAGTVGDITILSFSQDKMIDGISGGALISRDQTNLHLSGVNVGVNVKKQVIDKLYPLFTYFIRNTYSFGLGKVLHFILKNLKLLSGPMDRTENIHKLPDWYCQLIHYQFKNLNDNLNHRKKIASMYAKLINPKILSPLIVKQIPLSTNLRFPIFVENRENLIKYLEKNQIFVSDIWYDNPISPKCPNSVLTSLTILNLPTHINVSELDAEKISSLINIWLK